MCIPTTDQATSPAAAVTSPRMSINYKKNRILCGLCLVLGLFLRGLLVIFRNRKTPRFDACQKIAVRCRLDRNGCITSSYLILPPTKPAVGKSLGRPALVAGRFAFYGSIFFLRYTIKTPTGTQKHKQNKICSNALK